MLEPRAAVERSPDAWRRRAREFADQELRPLLADPPDLRPDGPLRQRLRRAELFGLGQPVEWGGGGESTETVAAVLEEIARVDPATAVLLSVHLSVCAYPIARWGTEAQKRQWLRPLLTGQMLGAFALTEPEAGSDAAALQSRYRFTGGRFTLTGAKTFISNGDSADLLLTFATHDPALGRRGISAFLVPRRTGGVVVVRHLEKLGLDRSETTELRFDDLELPPDRLLGPEGEGLGIALNSLVGGRIGIAACALGVARAALDELETAARTDPSDVKLLAVARSFSELEAAAALVQEAARRRDRQEPFAPYASAAKLAASRAALRIAHRAFDAWAEPTGERASRAGRLLRDARVFPIVEGTSEIQERILGRERLRPARPG